MVPQRPTPGNDPLPHSVVLTVGRARAAASSAIAAGLATLLQHDVGSWPQSGWQRLKQRTVRVVLRGELDGVPVHIKVYRPDTFADRARDALRGPRGEREARQLRRAADLGLPVVEALASGHCLVDDRLGSFVVTRSVAGQPFTFAAGPAVLAAAGALLRTLHDRGLEPGDLHPGNLLVTDAGELRLLDLASVRHVDHPDLAARARGLAFFCQELDGGALDPAAARLHRGYLDAGAPLPERWRDELTLATRRWRAQALPSFGRRATRDNRYTEVEQRRRGQPRWLFHRDGDGDGAPALRARLCAFAEQPPPPDKSGRRGAVWLTADFAVKQRDAAAALRLWRAAYWLTFARVPAAAPLALRLFAGKGLVFSRRLGASLAEELTNGHLDADAVRHAARSVGDSVGRLHAHGLGNRDLKLDNLVRDPRSGTVHMVDLDGVRRRAAIDSRGRGADLGRLLAAFRGAGSPGGLPTLRRFLSAYLRAHRRLLQAPPLRRLLRRAEQRAGEWASAHRVPAG
ncbi:MAG: hypothetical protein JNN13_04610 [Planctomycetes bacterium]|nr:hypothetical protein [Planctomycetota bacterium]